MHEWCPSNSILSKNVQPINANILHGLTKFVNEANEAKQVEDDIKLIYLYNFLSKNRKLQTVPVLSKLNNLSSYFRISNHRPFTYLYICY